jgi:structural maintenance of chromosome 4
MPPPAADAAMADAPVAADAAPAPVAPTSVCGARLGVTPGSRLMIREMVLDNFKSYAGEQRVGPFHKCFSSVVGPNGSGKSNVIDAMLFVFGRRAKQLRFSKVSELIHNSASHKQLERACVTVHFQEIFDTDGGGVGGAAAEGGGAGGAGANGNANAGGDGDTYTVVEGSAFTVARTATRSNASDYYVNGRKTSAKEAALLLKSKGVDLDNNRFLILQGEVEQISLMKPRGEGPGDTGLLEYLEDIIGTDALVPRIEEHGKR